MDRLRRPLILAALAAATVVLIGFAVTSHPRPAPVLSGYVEGEPLYLATSVSGPLAEVSVVRGQRVAAGDPLFRQDARVLAAQRDQALAGIAKTKAQASAARASLQQAGAAAAAARALADNARAEAARFQALSRSGAGAVSQQDVERAVANAAALSAQAKAAADQAEAARASAEAAAHGIDRAKGGFADVSTRLSYLSPTAPTAGRIEDVFHQAGEWAPAQQPVVSLIPDDRVRLRFFAPEAVVARYRPGVTVRFTCDACGGERRAVVNYVSPRPEYTPPVIYSRDTRDSLVFLVEAKPENPARLTPGLPVDVTPLAGAR